ncbi:TniQ family protein [Pseudomonas fildesensis]|uniref:TniQ family protein n=1 Tax=Pseudomonas fildesensis TaxID=1674920 RepID=UPI000B217822|nr:TniQ family protein [Pseudomonas fildesensis]
MLLTIQPNESLRSFLERHIYLDSQAPSAISLKQISRFYMRASAIRVIAAVIGSDNCYGFNRLLHDHTSYPQLALFRQASQVGYSGSKYLSSTTRFETEDVRPAFCIACVKEDIESIGFAYWRRDHRYVNVCAKHNVVLLKKCPVCKKSIEIHDHGYGYSLLWKGCKGRHVYEFREIINSDAREQTYSKIHEEIGRSRFYLLRDEVTQHLKEKAIEMASSEAISEEELEVIKSQLEFFRFCIPRLDSDYRPDHRYSKELIHVISTLYGSFGSLVDDIRQRGGLVRCIDDSMHAVGE